MGKNTTAATWLLVLAAFSVAGGASAPRYRIASFLDRSLFPESPSALPLQPRYELAPSSLPKSNAISLLSDGQPAPFQSLQTQDKAGPPGTIIGFTYRDWQAGGPTARHVDQRNGSVQAVFTAMDQPAAAESDIRWNRLTVAGSPAPVTLDNGNVVEVLPLSDPLVPGGLSLSQTQAQWPNIRIRPSGKSIVSFFGDNSWMVGNDLSAGSGIFQMSFGIQPTGAQYLSNPLKFSKSALSAGCGDTVVHILAGSFYDPRWELWYWRGHVSGSQITWDAPTFVDSTNSFSYLIEAQGASVAITYIRNFDGWQNRFCRLSTDCGVTWSQALNVTDWVAENTEAPWLDAAMVIDNDGVVHITWNTVYLDVATGIFEWLPANLYHWNSQRNTARLIAAGTWSNAPPDGCSQLARNGMGGNDLVYCDMSLSVKPAGAGPGAGIADELLYCIWAQGGPTSNDCATVDISHPGGGVNTEIYYSVSSDDGLTWDRPVNLTGSETPGCQPGNCHSERWVTASSRSDSGVYLSFLDDSHAGSAYQGESEWTLSPYMVMAAVARPVQVAPRIAVLPGTQFAELNAKTTGTASLDITILNVGNAPLNYNIAVTGDDGGSSHVLVNGSGVYNGSVPAGGSGQTVTVTYDGVGLPDPSEWDWRLEVTSNDSANNPGQGGQPIDIMLNVFVANAWYTCSKDTLSTGQHRLALNSCLRLGDAGVGGGLYSFVDGSEWLYEASPVLAWLDGATKRAYRDIYWNNATDRSRAKNKAFRAQSDIMVWRDTTVVLPDTSYPADVAKGVASSTDSLFQLDWQVTGFKSPMLSAGAVVRYLVTNRTGTTHTGLHLGAAADLDVDSMVEANYVIASSEDQYIGAQGGVRDSTGVVSLQQKYAALFFIPLDSGCQDRAAGGQALDNVDYTYPEGAYNTDSLYNVMNRMSGFDSSILQADTATDLNVVMVNVQDATLGPNDSLKFAFGFALSDVSLDDLAEKVALLRHAVNPRCLVGCPITLTGDVNLNGAITSADIISLVNFVFKGGTGPRPCAAAGDVNCNGSVTSADIISLVNFVFKGGPPPCDACAASPLAVDC